jgi:DNA-binding MarR family transcriptional regulator
MTAGAEDTPVDPFEALRLEHQVCFPLYAASNLTTRLYRPLLAELGLTYPQYLVMLALWERSPQTVTELGEALHLDSGTLTPLLKRMEAAGLVRRQRDLSDERRVQVRLTVQGEGLRERALSIPEKLAACLSIPPAELERLRHALQKLVQALARQVGRA